MANIPIKDCIPYFPDNFHTESTDDILKKNTVT